MSNDAMIDKAVLAIDKLQSREEWRDWSVTMRITLGQTWEYVNGDKKSPPTETDPLAKM